MKHHGRYELLTPDELALDIETGGCLPGYVEGILNRHRQKHRNDKRHKEKQNKRRLNGKKRNI